MKTALLVAMLLSPIAFSQTDSTETQRLQARIGQLKTEQAALGAFYQKEYENALQRYAGAILELQTMIREDSLRSAQADSAKGKK